MDLTTTPDALLDIIKEVTEGLLEERFIVKTKKYDKIDYKITDNGNQLLCIQITKCSSGYPNLKFLLTKAMKKQLNSKIIKKRATVAEVETKSPKTVRIQKVVCSRKSSFSLVDDNQIKRAEQTEFRELKRYVAIKLLLGIRTTNWKTFASLLRCYIMLIEQVHRNVKFVFRIKDGTKNTYIYRNKVKMDDILLSCNVLASSCEKIFRTSQNMSFQKDLENKFGLKKKKDFKYKIARLLHAQENKNFNMFIE